jgi:DNA polymerase IV
VDIADDFSPAIVTNVTNLWLLFTVTILYTVCKYSCGVWCLVYKLCGLCKMNSVTHYRKIIHCDADCFFAAIEMRDDPSLKDVPMAVGGDPYRRGVISTCNYEARAFGVRSALASAYAKKLCPQLIIIPHNMAKYRLAAEQLKSIFLDYTDKVEPLSLDEAYLDVSDVDIFNGSATLIAQDIRRRVSKEIGITVSAGIAPNKFIAKVASDWNKPNGLMVVDPSRVKFFLQHLPIKCIPGVGQQTALRLHSLGIYSCNDVLSWTEIALVQHFGKLGHRLHDFARGEDNRPVVTSYQRKSLSVEQTLDEDVAVDSCDLFLQALHRTLMTRLQALQSVHDINKVFIKIKFMDFSRTSIETSTAHVSLLLCESLFRQAWQRYQKPVRLIGIGVRFAGAMGVDTLKPEQLSLL